MGLGLGSFAVALSGSGLSAPVRVPTCCPGVGDGGHGRSWWPQWSSTNHHSHQRSM